jgi:Siphovirus Gp157
MSALHQETVKAKLLADALREAGFADDEDLLADTIEGETNAMEALSALLRWIALRTAHQEALKAAEGEFAARRTRMAESVQSARSAISRFMDETGLAKIERPEATLSMRDGPQGVVYADDFAPERLPEEFQRVSIAADKAAIKAALAIGQTIPGATLSNSPRVLAIRTK